MNVTLISLFPLPLPPQIYLTDGEVDFEQVSILRTAEVRGQTEDSHYSAS